MSRKRVAIPSPPSPPATRIRTRSKNFCFLARRGRWLVRRPRLHVSRILQNRFSQRVKSGCSQEWFCNDRQTRRHTPSHSAGSANQADTRSSCEHNAHAVCVQTPESTRHPKDDLQAFIHADTVYYISDTNARHSPPARPSDSRAPCHMCTCSAPTSDNVASIFDATTCRSAAEVIRLWSRGSLEEVLCVEEVTLCDRHV